jgi:hypothetical protein
VRFFLFACLTLVVCAAHAARVEVPVRVPLETVRQALETQMGVTYRWDACRHLKLGTPKLQAVDGRLRFVSPGSAAFGVPSSPGNCLNAATWQGSMHFTLAPRLDAAGRLRLRIVDSRLTDASGRKGPGLIWDLARGRVEPRLQEFSYDIGAATLLSVMRGAAPPEHRLALEHALTQMQILEPRVEAKDIVIPIALEIPDAWLMASAAAGASAPLTEAELEALEQALQPWDAFLVYAIKNLAIDNADSELRKRLFGLLLDSRHQLASILSGETRTSGDPIRALFVETWNDMRSILADARYTLFLDAGDALLALDRAAPGLGMALSADGLRQLARSLRPNDAEDPLAHDWTVDPQLGELFEVEPLPEIAPEEPKTSGLNFFIRTSDAAPPALDRWLPKRDEMEAYEKRVGDLLHRTSASEIARANLPAAHAEIYRHMVPVTALIESCWRQYTVRAGKLTFLRSGSGSVGIMQINQVVWRGFYEVERLRWDTAYNMRAGAQILMRYLKDYAVPYAEKNGDATAIPRAAYAVYNAGPKAVGRFNKNPPHPREQRVDEHLWTLYKGVSSGGRVDLRNCGVNGAA